MNDHNFDPLRDVLGQMCDKYNAMGDRTGQHLDGFGMHRVQEHGYLGSPNGIDRMRPFGDWSPPDGHGPRGDVFGGPTLR